MGFPAYHNDGIVRIQSDAVQATAIFERPGDSDEIVRIEQEVPASLQAEDLERAEQRIDEPDVAHLVDPPAAGTVAGAAPEAAVVIAATRGRSSPFTLTASASGRSRAPPHSRHVR